MTRHRPLSALLASAIALLAAPAAAEAGSYDVLACDAAPSGVNRTWVAENSDSVHMETSTACPSNSSYSGLYARTRLNSGGPVTGAYTQWIFRAPSGTTISRVRLMRWLGMEGGSGWRLYGRQADGTTIPGETCTVASGQYECNVGGHNTTPVDYTVNTSSIAYGMQCNGAGSCGTGLSIYAARAAIYSARVTLSESTVPTVSAPTGPLVSEAGYHRGTESASFTGSDATTGLSAQRIYIDGIERAAQALPCDYTYAIPCSNPSSDKTLSVNLAATTSGGTRVVPDGTRAVQVAAVDAAGNETRSAAKSILVDATAPAAPSALATSTGSSWQTSRDFTATWTQPAGQVAPIDTAHWTLCPSGATTGCTIGSATVPGSAGALSGLQVPSEGAWDFSLRLRDAAGNTATGNVAQTTIRYDASGPAASPNLGIGNRDTGHPSFLAYFNPPADQLAPVTDVLWTLCRHDSASGCASGTFGADPNSTNYLNSAVPSHGDWILTVRFRDQAGNVGAPATTTLRYASSTATPSPLPTPAPPVSPTPAQPAPHGDARADAQLRIASAVLDRSRRALTVRGRTTATATGKVTVKLTVTRGGRTHTVNKTVATRGGRFTVRVRLSRPDSGGRIRVSVAYSGSSTHAPARTARRTVRIR